MIFEVLSESAERGELILVDGGICHWHLRRDGQITIREILVLPEYRGQGVGRNILSRLKQVDGAVSIFAKCPADLCSNSWYCAQGFVDEGDESTRSGRTVRRWRFLL